MADGQERLQKILAAAGVASRRASEALIAAGRVTVDGRVARLGDQADPATARIEVDGRPIGGPSAPIYLAVHKPGGVTSTVRDPHAERTVLQLLPTAFTAPGVRLYPVGRLDRDSEGLLLLTNDGAWAERVLHPRFGVDREYAVGLPASLTAEQRRALHAGIELDEGLARLARPIRQIDPTETAALARLLVPPPVEIQAWYRVVLRQGWKRQIRRMFGAIGVPITRLVRTRIGPVRLDGLGSGQHRRLRGSEIRGLAAGATPRGAEAGRPAATSGTATGRRLAASPNDPRGGGTHAGDARPGGSRPGGTRSNGGRSRPASRARR